MLGVSTAAEDVDVVVRAAGLARLERARREPADTLTINPWPSRPLLDDEELPLMSACPVAALPNARLPTATHLMIAQWGA